MVVVKQYMGKHGILFNSLIYFHKKRLLCEIFLCVFVYEFTFVSVDFQTKTLVVIKLFIWRLKQKKTRMKQSITPIQNFLGRKTWKTFRVKLKIYF